MIPLRFSGFTIFQPTRPLRGATGGQGGILSLSPYFNPRAPCGARHDMAARLTDRQKKFQPTRPLRGATLKAAGDGGYKEFQPTRPLRGATFGGYSYTKRSADFNPRAPCGARLPISAFISSSRFLFQPTRPLRGATTGILGYGYYLTSFQPTRPLRGATISSAFFVMYSSSFQPTRPLRGATVCTS